MYIENCNVELVPEPIESLSDRGIGRIGQQNHISLLPGERFCQTIYGICCVENHKDVVDWTVDPFRHKGSWLCQHHFRIFPKPQFNIELAFPLKSVLIVHDSFRTKSVASMIDIDIFLVHIEVLEPLFAKRVHINLVWFITKMISLHPNWTKP